MRGMHHVPNALTACMGGYSWSVAGGLYSRIAPATTHGEQPSSRSTRVLQWLARTHSRMSLTRVWRRSALTYEGGLNVPRPVCVHRVHGRLQLMAGRLGPHQATHHAW